MRWHIKQCTDNNKNMKWCPNKTCNKIIEKNSYAISNSITCECETSFCFNCLQEDHNPSTCSQVEKWLEKEVNDGENVTWLKANTKNCPKCVSAIEKNQGCNQMTCGKCGHHFCWLCLGDRSTHDYNQCNVYNDPSKNKDVMARQKVIEDSQMELHRY